MVFRISSSSKRSARESWRTTRIWAGVMGGSSGSSGSGSAIGAGTVVTGRSASAGAAGAVGGASSLALGLFLEPGGLPRRLGAGCSGSGWAAVVAGGAGAGAGVDAAAPTSSAGGAAAAASFVWIVSSIALFQAFIAPRSSEQPVSRSSSLLLCRCRSSVR